MTEIITHKNNLLFKNAKGTLVTLPIKDANMKNLPEGKLSFRVNKQWLTVSNRYKIEMLAEGHMIKNNTVYPATDVKTQYETILNWVPTKMASVEIEKKDLEILKSMIEKYNVSSIKKQIVKLSIKL